MEKSPGTTWDARLRVLIQNQHLGASEAASRILSINSLTVVPPNIYQANTVHLRSQKLEKLDLFFGHLEDHLRLYVVSNHG